VDHRFVRAATAMAAVFTVTGCAWAPVSAPTVTVTTTVTPPPEPAPTVTVQAEPPRDGLVTKEQAWSLCAAGLGILYAARDRDGDGELDQSPPVDAEGAGRPPADDYVHATPLSDYDSVHEQEGGYLALVPIQSTRQDGYHMLATCNVSGSMDDPRLTVSVGTLSGD